MLIEANNGSWLNTRTQHESALKPIARKGQGAAPLRSPINTRILYAVATNSIAKKGVQRVEDPLAGQGAAPLRSPINTRILYAVATNSIAKKGVQRVEDPLAGSRDSAPAFPHKHAHTVCSSDQLNREKGSPEGRRPFGRVKGQRPLRLSIVLAFFARIKGKKAKRC